MWTARFKVAAPVSIRSTSRRAGARQASPDHETEDMIMRTAGDSNRDKPYANAACAFPRALHRDLSELKDERRGRISETNAVPRRK